MASPYLPCAGIRAYLMNSLLIPAKRSVFIAAPAPAHRAEAARPWGFPEWFIISQTVIPALLYLPGSNAFRLPIRIAPFAISLLGFLYLPVKSAQATPAHPARRSLKRPQSTPRERSRH